MKSTLLAAAAPATAYRAKFRPHRKNAVVSLGGMFGVARTLLQRPSAGEQKDEWESESEVHLPIGLDIAPGRLTPCSWLSGSLFFSLLDPAQYIVQSAQKDLNVTESILAGVSPGFYLRGLIGESPVGFSLGVTARPRFPFEAGNWDTVFSASLDLDATLWILRGE